MHIYTRMELEIIVAVIAGVVVLLLWLRKSRIYRKKLEEFNASLETRIEEKTNDLKRQLFFTRTLIETIPNPVYYKDADGRYLGCNKAYEVFFNCRKEDMVGKCTSDFYMPEEAAEREAIDRHLLVGSGAIQYRTAITLKNGEKREVIYYKAAFDDINGVPAGIIGVVQDITQLKKANETIVRQNEELEKRIAERTRSLEDANNELTVINRELELRRTEAEYNQKKLQQLSSAVVHSPAVIVITDANGFIEYVNPKFTELTGYLPDEVVGRNPRILNAGLQTKEFYLDLWSTILAGKEWSGEFCNRKKNGDIYWEHALISPIIDEKGGILNFVAVKDDITERRRMAGELLAAKEAADSAARTKSQFLANMSHEIRTPLNAIIGFSSLILRSGLPDPQSDYAERIHTAGEILLNIINDILDFSKIEAGQLQMERIPFCLEDVIANVTGILQHKADEKKLELTSRIAAEVPPLLIGDPHRLSQILLNLMNNAIKFTEHGKVSLEAELLEADHDGYRLLFSVADTGIGMPEEIIDKLFHPFTQADSATTRRFGGTGLGLSISKQLVELMGGEIWCKSVVGEGSCFYFTMLSGVDSMLVAGKPDAASGFSNLPERSSYDFGGARILIAEDNEINREVTREFLKDTGAILDFAEDGREAVAMVLNGDRVYDLVLMDIQMPDMDGYEAASTIRRDSRFVSLPIIAMTAHAMESEREKILASGMNAFISKPVNVRKMLQVIGSFLPSAGKAASDSSSYRPNGEILREIPSISGVDASAALELFDGDIDTYLSILRIFVESYPDSAAIIGNMLKNGESDAAMRKAHTLKGVAGTIGAKLLQQLAGELEACISKGEPDEIIRKALTPFAEELERVVSEMSAKFSEQQKS